MPRSDLCEAVARKGDPIFEQLGDVWWQADVELGLFPGTLSGRRLTRRGIQAALPRAVRIGHDMRDLRHWTLVESTLPRGLRARSGRPGKLSSGEVLQAGLTFLAEAARQRASLPRQDRGSHPTLTNAAGSQITHLVVSEGLLALGLTAAGMETRHACNAAMRLLPRPGTSRSTGAWNAAILMTETFASADAAKKPADCRLRRRRLPRNGTVGSRVFLRERGGDRGNVRRQLDAPRHHRAAIARVDEVPYVTAQPIARYWYAWMLAGRGGPGDIDAAEAMLKESIATSDAIGLALYARLARKGLDQIA